MLKTRTVDGFKGTPTHPITPAVITRRSLQAYPSASLIVASTSRSIRSTTERGLSRSCSLAACRKPGRFSKLKEVAHSQAFPPPLVACYEGSLDATTQKRFRDGLLEALPN